MLPWLGLLLLACGGERPSAAPPPGSGPGDTAGPPAAPAAPRAAGDAPLIVFLGTSLTAGLGVDPSDAYPALIQAKVDSAGLRYQVMNAGVSGETSAGALRRLDWILSRPVAVLVVETGANDGLRGQSPDSIRANIEAILDRAARASPPPRVLLVGMEAMPNLGAAYVQRFRAIYPAVARERGIPLVPFLLQGVAGVDSLNQADGIHPTPAGHRIMAATVWRALRPMLAGRAAAAR